MSFLLNIPSRNSVLREPGKILVLNSCVLILLFLDAFLKTIKMRQTYILFFRDRTKKAGGDLKREEKTRLWQYEKEKKVCKLLEAYGNETK